MAALLLMLGAACGGPNPAPPGTPTTPSTPAPSTPAPSTSPAPLPSAPATRSELPAGFVELHDVDPTILEDIRYHTSHNFVGRPIVGYTEPLCVLTREAASALKRAQTAARAEGYTLKVYDCYRPMRAGDYFADWAARPDDESMKAEFFPNVAKSDLFADGYVGGGRSSHSRGSAVDLTLVRLPAASQRPFVPGEPLTACTAPADRRFPDNTVDMGTGFDCFDPRSHTMDDRITGPARENRLRLRRLMTAAGFANYANEWWHYSLVNDPHPTTYQDFPLR